MLSYQHEYHAGNHADILKHTCLCMILESLCKKDKPYTIIDMHSSSGRFSLDDERLLKTGEAKEGIEKLYNFYHNPAISFNEDLKKYMEKEVPYMYKKLYAGSPEIEKMYLRDQDTMFAIEKHPEAIINLQENLKQDIISLEGKIKPKGKINIINNDSYQALKGLLPPLVKRGLILCDPSYEDASDYTQITESLTMAHKKWNTAIIALWYPLISRRKNETAQMLSSLEQAAKLGNTPVESFRCELIVKDPKEMNQEDGPHLYGSGMFIMNPPWLLKENLEKASAFILKLFNLRTSSGSLN